jgi:hypothetical protein
MPLLYRVDRETPAYLFKDSCIQAAALHQLKIFICIVSK